jgi:hypothetical protein
MRVGAEIDPWGGGTIVEKRYYDVGSLERVIRVYETHFGLASGEFYEAHLADHNRVADIPRSQRQNWASFYREWRELGGEGDFAHQVERQLEPA